jgi:Fic family protein
MAETLSRADQQLGKLGGLAANLPNPHLLIGPFMRREAVLSSRIEGTQASLSDLFLFEAAQAEPVRGSDVREVMNYVRAMEHGLRRLSDLPLSLRFIREIHERLMHGVRGENMTPGEFRRSQNWIGPPGCTLTDATFVPPRLPEMHEALSRFESYLHAPTAFPALIKLALVHYQFEAIHPFLDGNGRVGRLLVTLQLCHGELLPEPLLYLSAFFEKNRRQYYDLLLSVSRSGNWSGWVNFFLEGVAEQANDAVARTKAVLELWKEYRQRFESARSSALVLRLVDKLFETPAITIPRTADFLGVTYRSASLNVQKLVAAGILKEVTGRDRNKVYLARAILDVAERAAG